jgi:hypothetical protein
MEECHPKALPTATQEPASQKAVPKFVSLPTKYNLLQHQIYVGDRSSTDTKEAEFEKYKNGSLSPHDTDLVEFWSVSAVFFQIIPK